MARFLHGANATGSMSLNGRLMTTSHPNNVGHDINTFMAKGHWTADSESGKIITVDPGFTPEEWVLSVINHGGAVGDNNVDVNVRFAYEDGTTFITHGTTTEVLGNGGTAFITFDDAQTPKIQVMVSRTSGDTIHGDGVTVLVKARRSSSQLSEQSAFGDYSANTLTPVTP